MIRDIRTFSIILVNVLSIKYNYNFLFLKSPLLEISIFIIKIGWHILVPTRTLYNYSTSCFRTQIIDRRTRVPDNHNHTVNLLEIFVTTNPSTFTFTISAHWPWSKLTPLLACPSLRSTSLIEKSGYSIESIGMRWGFPSENSPEMTH